jgi:hypothetical protein
MVYNGSWGGILADYSDEMGGRTTRAATARPRTGSGGKSRHHAIPEEIETYGGQPNTSCRPGDEFDPAIWNGYTGAAGWMFRQALEGARPAARANEVVFPANWQTLADGLRVAAFRELRAQASARLPWQGF